MSDDGGVDLSGCWTGFYSYVDHPFPTPFEATIRDSGGLLGGLISEDGDTPDCHGTILHALIEGRREGRAVRFTKYYDYLPRADYAILYSGTLHQGDDEIEGIWEIVGVHSGTFLMVRASEERLAEEKRASEKV